MTDTSDSDIATGVKNGTDELEVLAAGSRALLENSPLNAIPLYKSVLEKISHKPGEQASIAHLVLRYSLCIACLKSNDFSHICKAIESLSDMVGAGFSNKLPAVYLALAKAYLALNRFKSAFDIIGEGLKTIRKFKVKQQCWPGLQTPIDETCKDFLEAELRRLLLDCRKVQPPDSTCQYERCLEYSSHVIPSRDIYFSDLDFVPFYLIQCEANCKFAYHDLCWENIKFLNLQIEEPQDLLGMECPTEACASRAHKSIIVDVKLIGSDGFNPPLKTWHINLNSSTKIRNATLEQHHLSVKESSTNDSSAKVSTLQAKSESHCMKDKDNISDNSVLLPLSIVNLLCSSEDDVKSKASDSSKFMALLDTLNLCRTMKFGYSDDEFRSPQLQCCGHPYEKRTTYLEPDEIDESGKDTAEFIFSFYQSMFDKNGLYRIEDLQETWKTTVSDLGISEEFTNKYQSVSEFLLKSERFAAIDDVIGTSELLPDMFFKAEIEITQSITFLLFSQVSNPRSKEHADTSHEVHRTNNNVSDSHSHVCSLPPSTDLDGNSKVPSKEKADKFIISTPNTTSKDKNDNPICSTSLSMQSLKSTDGVHVYAPVGAIGSTPPKPDGVYMSDDDEEIDDSFNEKDKSTLALNKDEVININSPLICLKQGEIHCPSVTHQQSQTIDFVDTEKWNLTYEKEALVKEKSALEHEKAELLSRIESIKEEMKELQSTLELKVGLKSKIIENLLERRQEQNDAVRKVEEQNLILQCEVKEQNDVVSKMVSQVSELEMKLDKLRRSHAKEINNFEQRLKQEKKLKEEEFQNQLRSKDLKLIELWKEFCEFKITKFHHLFNDRIIVLSQLKDMMSDSVRPTKSDIKSLIESFEEQMILVNQKNIDINDVFNKQREKLKEGTLVTLPSVIDVPDSMNTLYPPEGAFEYLHNILKFKQEEYLPPRNHFSPAVSRSHRAYTNGLQNMSQTFQPSSNSSLFSQEHSDTPLLWNNSFCNPSAHSSLGFDVGGSNGSHLPLHQGFGVASSMMPQQSALNLMPSIIPFSSNSSQQAMMNSARSTPSPLLSYSCLPLNSHASANNALGSKASSLGAIQKTISNTAPPNPVPKTTPTVVPTVASTAVPSQGAVSKPKIQNLASMTPIVPSKPTTRPIMKTSVFKPSISNFDKLFANCQKMFPTRNDAEITEALKTARSKSGGTLSSLSHSEIISKVDEILRKQSKQTAMGWEKFGEAAWGTAAKTSVIEWEGSKDDQEDCCICMTLLNSQEVYTLECKHAFHKECIKKWLVHEGICPICRIHSTMLDEFPPLG